MIRRTGSKPRVKLKKIMPAVPIILLTLHASTIYESFAENLYVDLVVPKGDHKHLMDSVRTLLFVGADSTTDDSATI